MGEVVNFKHLHKFSKYATTTTKDLPGDVVRPALSLKTLNRLSGEKIKADMNTQQGWKLGNMDRAAKKTIQDITHIDDEARAVSADKSSTRIKRAMHEAKKASQTNVDLKALTPLQEDAAKAIDRTPDKRIKEHFYKKEGKVQGPDIKHRSNVLDVRPEMQSSIKNAAKKAGKVGLSLVRGGGATSALGGMVYQQIYGDLFPDDQYGPEL